MERHEADVCVVGAGFAGMAAAWQLHKAGLEVAVLEARDRVGGRTWSVYLEDGTHIDRGGAWFGPGQDRSYGLAEEMGKKTYPQHSEGDTIFVEKGKPRRYTGTVPLRVNPLHLASLATAMLLMNRMAKQVPLGRPWEAKKAREWDSQSVGGWLEGHVLRGTSRDIMTDIISEFCTCDLAETSLLHALHYVHSSTSIETIISVKGGLQQDRVVGGATSILYEMQQRLGDTVRLNSPVRNIDWTSDSVTVTTTAGTTVSARHAVVAIPPCLLQRIWWDPQLPRDRSQLVQRTPAGQIFKIHLVYDSPFWREEGLSGQTLDSASIVPATIDACGPASPPGILCALAFGTSAYELGRLSPAERRATVISEMAERFGHRAGAVSDYIEQDWAEENWSGGAYTAHFGPGVLTNFGHALHEPMGNVHWAGTELGPRFMGCMDGAVRSGERAAQNILAARNEREKVGAA